MELIVFLLLLHFVTSIGWIASIVLTVVASYLFNNPFSLDRD